MEKINVSGLSFVDEHGRERIFTGMNIVDKGNFGDGKFTFAYEIDDKLLKSYKALGFNIIRLGFSWGAMEPEPGHYNDVFLDEIEKIVNRCAQHGVYVFLDSHQDCYSNFCHNTASGAPEWAFLIDGLKPTKAKLVWAEGYFISKTVHRAFDSFWDNREYGGKGLQDYYAGMWAHVAERFKDKPNLFSFDYFNEPFPGKSGGTLFKKMIANLVKVTLTDKRVKKGQMIKDALKKDRRVHVLDQYPGDVFADIISVGEPIVKEFDIERYTPFLNRMTKALRGVTDKGIVFTDNCYYSNLGIPCHNEPITVDGKREPNQCFSPHGYDLMVDTPAYKYANNSRVGALFAQHRKTQERLGSPCLVGEWGGDAPGTEWLPHVDFLLNTFAKYKWSHTYWHFSHGHFEAPLMDVLSRPYPKAVTGEIGEYRYDLKAKELALDFKQEVEFDVPNIIYVKSKPQKVTLNGTDLEYVFIESNGDIEFMTSPGQYSLKITI